MSRRRRRRRRVVGRKKEIEECNKDSSYICATTPLLHVYIPYFFLHETHLGAFI
jgi:hypothetical protein